MKNVTGIVRDGNPVLEFEGGRPVVGETYCVLDTMCLPTTKGRLLETAAQGFVHVISIDQNNIVTVQNDVAVTWWVPLQPEEELVGAIENSKENEAKLKELRERLKDCV